MAEAKRVEGAKPSRRGILRMAGLAAVSMLPLAQAREDRKPGAERYRVAACDWMLLKRQKPSALELGRECGLDGVEVDMGKLGDRPDLDNRLRNEADRKQYLDASQKSGVAICSLALSAFYGHVFEDHPKVEALLTEWIELMQALKVPCGFLPLGLRCDPLKQPEARRKIVALFKKAGPAAEKAKVLLGLETTLDADGHIKLFDEIGSPAVVASYNLGDQLELGRKLPEEIRKLGKARIGQIHCKEGSVRLGQGLIDFPPVKKALDEIDWSGWLIIERSRLPGKSVVENFSANASYLKGLFQKD